MLLVSRDRCMLNGVMLVTILVVCYWCLLLGSCLEMLVFE